MSRGTIPLNRNQALKAVGIFFLSLAAAVIAAFSLPLFVPENECAFPVLLDREATEAGVRATVTRVEGSYPVAALGYRAIRLDAQEERIVQEGRLTDLSAASPGLSFHRVDATADLLQPGDHFRWGLEGDVHLILLEEGTPIGWTRGCV